MSNPLHLPRWLELLQVCLRNWGRKPTRLKIKLLISQFLDSNVCVLGDVRCQLNGTQRYHKASLSPHEVNKLQRFWSLRGSSVLAGLTLHHAGLQSDADKPQAARGPTCVHGPGGGWVPHSRGGRAPGGGGCSHACAGHRTGHSLPACGFPSCSTGAGGRVTAKPPAPAAPRVTRQEADGIRIPSGLTGGSVRRARSGRVRGAPSGGRPALHPARR